MTLTLNYVFWTDEVCNANFPIYWLYSFHEIFLAVSEPSEDISKLSVTLLFILVVLLRDRIIVSN